MCTIWPFCQRQSKDIVPTWRTSLSLVQVQILGNTSSSLLSSCHPTSWRMQRPNTKIQWNKPASLRAKNPERAAPSPWTSLGFVAWEKMEVFQRCMQGSGTNRLCCTYQPGTAKAGIGNVPLIQRAAGGGWAISPACYHTLDIVCSVLRTKHSNQPHVSPSGNHQLVSVPFSLCWLNTFLLKQ